MGHLRYGQDDLEVEDRLLAHLQTVVAQKIRRRESFILSLTDKRAARVMTSALWISASSSIHFSFSGSRQPELNSSWLDLMMQATYSTNGLDTDRVVEPPR